MIAQDASQPDPTHRPDDLSAPSQSPTPVIGDEDDLNAAEYLAKRRKRHLGESLDDSTATAPGATLWDQDGLELPRCPSAGDTMKESDHDPVQLPSPEDLILESGRLFLRNLSFSVTEREIQDLFCAQGPVSQVHILVDSVAKPKGLAYVTFEKSADALAAYRALDQTDFQGRLLHILPAVTRRSRVPDPASKKSLKSEKDLKRKAESGQHFNWASLYMNSDAVISSVADRMNVSKSELLDPSAQNPAVKLALAETHVICETRQFLEDHGINTEVFNQVAAIRSPTTILVKNIPYGTTQATLRGLFAEHGSVSQVLIPPAGTIAVVEMLDAEGGKNAFRALAYKRIGNSVIYLEKAPQGLWRPRASEGLAEVDTKPPAAISPQGVCPQGQAQSHSTLFVKNLSFDTTGDTFAQAFKNLPGYLFSRVQTKPDPRNPGRRLSMGYGFVGFKTAAQAQIGLKASQGSLLNGHVLDVKFANRNREDEEAEAEGDQVLSSPGSSHKLIIKNLPFEINKKELYELFSSFGKLKSVRIPKKLHDRRSRGFGFIEFLSANAAKEAMKTLKHSHLLGRHLVMEFANQMDADVEELKRRNGIEEMALQNSGKFGFQRKTKFQGLKPGTGQGNDSQDVIMQSGGED